jgi:acyl carrier protein phosphodiesterase
MNHLAHALLSGTDPHVRLGGMLGDFLRGRIDPMLPDGVRRGVELHRAIDSFTDRHADVASARRLFVSPFRRYAGILIDIWFDHLLARDFAAWSVHPLAHFSDDLQALLRAHDDGLPEGLQRFSRYMQARNLPAAYARRDMIDEVLHGVSTRLRHANPVANGLTELLRLEPELDRLFQQFFPQLVAFAEQWRESGVD